MAAELSPGLAKMIGRMSTFASAESPVKGANFKPRPDDVIVCTPPKSGTTWVQQICHGLRSRGNMDFEEMCLVFPCMEMAHDYGYTDLDIEQPFHPRMYKTHFWYPLCPKGAGKYIIVVRRPADCAVSFYHFMENWMFEKGEVSMEEYVEVLFLPSGAPSSPADFASQMHHIASWYPHRLDDSVLWLHFEDLKQDLKECVRLISEFLGIGANDEELQDLVVRQSSLEFMKQHITKFDEHPIKFARNPFASLPKTAGLENNAGKARKGLSNESKDVLSDEILSKIDRRWKEVVAPSTGYASYDELRRGINKELGRSYRDQRFTN